MTPRTPSAVSEDAQPEAERPESETDGTSTGLPVARSAWTRKPTCWLR